MNEQNPTEPSHTPGLDAELYDALRSIASAQMRQERGYHTLQPTAVVHEAFLRLGGPHDPRWHDRDHFVSAAVTTMRRVLVDHARGVNSQKRGGGRRLHLTSWGAIGPDSASTLDVSDVHDALLRLERSDPECARVVEFRYFGGLTIEETATALGIGRNTAVRRWRAARAWLKRELGAAGGEGTAHDAD